MLADSAANDVLSSIPSTFIVESDLDSKTSKSTIHKSINFAIKWFFSPPEKRKRAKEIKINVRKFNKIWSLIVKNESFYAVSFSPRLLFQWLWMCCVREAAWCNKVQYMKENLTLNNLHSPLSSMPSPYFLSVRELFRFDSVFCLRKHTKNSFRLLFRFLFFFALRSIFGGNGNLCFLPRHFSFICQHISFRFLGKAFTFQRG